MYGTHKNTFMKCNCNVVYEMSISIQISGILSNSQKLPKHIDPIYNYNIIYRWQLQIARLELQALQALEHLATFR